MNPEQEAYAVEFLTAIRAQTEQLRIANLIAWTTGSGYSPNQAAIDEVTEALWPWRKGAYE